MKTCVISVVVAGCASLSFVQAQDVFGTGENKFTMAFVNVGDAGNAADETDLGSVGYRYRMGKYEVSRGMIDAYNALSGGPKLDMADMSRFAGGGANRPATGLSWNEAARFVNWLNTSRGHSAAYKFTTGGGNDDIALWTSTDEGYDAGNPFRNSKAHYFLPSEDEWYKAAYYDPAANSGAGGYWNFATGSDAAPEATRGGTVKGTAVFRDGVKLRTKGPADITNAGGLSPYGTMAQNGNVYEWGESGITPPNDKADGLRPIRGGLWISSSDQLSSSFRLSNKPSFQYYNIGFRVASVSQP